MLSVFPVVYSCFYPWIKTDIYEALWDPSIKCGFSSLLEQYGTVLTLIVYIQEVLLARALNKTVFIKQLYTKYFQTVFWIKTRKQNKKCDSWTREKSIWSGPVMFLFNLWRQMFLCPTLGWHYRVITFIKTSSEDTSLSSLQSYLSKIRSGGHLRPTPFHGHTNPLQPHEAGPRALGTFYHSMTAESQSPPLLISLLTERTHRVTSAQAALLQELLSQWMISNVKVIFQSQPSKDDVIHNKGTTQRHLY